MHLTHRIVHARTVPFVLLLIILAGSSCTKKKRKAPPVCEVNSTTCSSTLEDGTTVTFSIEPRPVRSMALLKFDVGVAGGPGSPSNISLDFKMPAMYMGENKVALTSSSGGHFVGTGTIVKCPTGDRLWDAAVLVQRAGQPDAIVHFRFEVDR